MTSAKANQHSGIFIIIVVAILLNLGRLTFYSYHYCYPQYHELGFSVLDLAVKRSHDLIFLLIQSH